MADPQPNNDFEANFFYYFDDTLACSIYQATRLNDKNTLQKLLMERKKNPSPLRADDEGYTALHVAAFRPQYKDCLDLLLECRDDVLLDIDARTLDGKTAFHIACKNGCEESAKILRKYGCDFDTITKDGYTPLLAALNYENNMKVIEFLLNFSTAHFNLANKYGSTPLHRSAQHGYLEISRILLKGGADAQSRDKSGYLPLHFACENGHLDTARLLLKNAPITMNVQNAFGTTPLMFALQDECNIEFIRFLLDNGASTDIYDEEGRLALHFAVYRGDVGMLRLILQYTEASSIHHCLSYATGKLEESESLVSLSCAAINSRNVECLETLLLSSKISKSILEIPMVKNKTICSPLAYLFSRISNAELLNSYLQLLLKHEITTFDEFSTTVPGRWSHNYRIVHPFSFIIERPITEQLHHFNVLDANNVDMDYCLQLYHQKNEPFDTFTDYERYYEPLRRVLCLYSGKRPSDRHLKILKLLMSTTVILEPDVVCIKLNPIHELPDNCIMSEYLEERRELFQYLIRLKPVYFTQFRLLGRNNETDVPRFPYATLEEEFAQSSLQQLCRTIIRKNLREPTLDDNLRNFKRKIMELPLPTYLKNYLLFKE